MPKGRPRPKKNLASQRVIAALKTTKERGERFYDANLKGFGITVYPSGRKIFFVEYGKRTRRRRMTLGPYGVLTPDKARRKAKSVQGQFVDGHDPLDDRRRRQLTPTVKEWIADWLAKIELGVRPQTHAEYTHYLDAIPDAWAHRPLDEITPSDIRKLMMRVAAEAQERVVKRTFGKRTRCRKLSEDQLKKLEAKIREEFSSGGRITANRWLAAIRSCLSAAVSEGVLNSNPAHAVDLNTRNPPRDRVLSEEELKRLLEAIDQEGPHDRAAIRLAIETGARRSEILRARWEDIDLDDGLWRVPSPKAGKPQVIPLAEGTIELLRSLPHASTYVIAGRKPDRPRYDLKGLWKRACFNAKLDGVTFHDLRRTFGKRIERQFGVHVASKLLRHSDVRITSEIYTPFDIEELRSAVESEHQALDNVVSIEGARKPRAKGRGHG